MKKPKMVDKIVKEPDLEMHVRTVFIGGEEFVEVRDYIPSTQTYSRGVVFRRHQIPDLISALKGVR